MNVEVKKGSPTSFLYCVRVSTLDGHFSFGAPFLARDDQQACELVRQSLKESEVKDYERGDLVCLASFTLWHEKKIKPLSKSDVKRGGYLVCNCGTLIPRKGDC